MREVNKKILVACSVLTLLMMLFALPVMAKPTKGQKVPASFTVIPPSTMTPGELKWTPSGVAHGKGLVEVYAAILVIDGTPYDATFVINGQVGSWNPQTGTMIMNNKDILYITSYGSPDGFSGMGSAKLYGWDWSTFMWTSQKMYSILHGFGSFEGQTLMLSYEGPISATTTGYCLKG